jgi:hypothetical protein
MFVSIYKLRYFTSLSGAVEHSEMSVAKQRDTSHRTSNEPPVEWAFPTYYRLSGCLPFSPAMNRGVRGIQNLLFSQWGSEYGKKGTVNSCENEGDANVKRETDNYCCTGLINVLDRKNKDRRRVWKVTSERNDGKNVDKFWNRIPFLAFPYIKNFLFRFVSTLCNHEENYRTVLNNASSNNGRVVSISYLLRPSARKQN